MTLEELSQQYCEEAAALAAKIDEHRQKKDRSPAEIYVMERMLEELRLNYHTIAGYYTAPRPGVVDSSSWRAPHYARPSDK